MNYYFLLLSFLLILLELFGGNSLANVLCAADQPIPAATILIEAEQFDEYGGWVNDSQFMDQMGSPFLLAHGLGIPVADAQVKRAILPGRYYVWVRTRDWVAPWNAPGTPGRFQLLVNGQPLPILFGTEGSAWHWQSGGMVEISQPEITLALHDLTGFEGRCDAILLTPEPNWTPPHTGSALLKMREEIGSTALPLIQGEYDLVVAGGGVAGTCAAVGAARLGLRVALVQDRPVLGGNNSSEVRVWLQGARNIEPYKEIGNVVEELEQKRFAHYGPSNTADLYEDDKKLTLVRNEKNIDLFLEYRVNRVGMQGNRLQSLFAEHVRTGQKIQLHANSFVDSTGDGCLGFLAGADFEMTLDGHMGPCNLWHVIETGESVSFPKCPWALDLTDKPFPGRSKVDILQLGGWYWESGFFQDPLQDAEIIRDLNFRAAYGAWDALKNVDNVLPTWKLLWMASIAGKRESRRLLGDVVLSGDDLLQGKKYPDAAVPTGWKMDLHLPDPAYQKGFEGNEFISTAHFTSYKIPYWIPYRCLYSRNIENLFMAGRDISVTHEALGATRVMRTGGCMGEVVAMAASLCKKHNTTPRGVYQNHLAELVELMTQGIPHHEYFVPVAPLPVVRQHLPKLTPSRTNLATQAKVEVTTPSDEKFSPTLLNEGLLDFAQNDLRWIGGPAERHEIEFHWPKLVTLGTFRVVSGYTVEKGPYAPLSDFVLQQKVDGQWADIPETTILNNTLCDFQRSFSPIIVSEIRLVITKTQDNKARIWEIELF